MVQNLPCPDVSLEGKVAEMGETPLPLPGSGATEPGTTAYRWPCHRTPRTPTRWPRCPLERPGHQDVFLGSFSCLIVIV